MPLALASVGRGGTVVLAGIHMTDIPTLSYRRHLFQERDLRTVASNTRRDGEELLALATRLELRARVTTYPFARTDEALQDVSDGNLGGSAVVTLG